MSTHSVLFRALHRSVCASLPMFLALTACQADVQDGPDDPPAEVAWVHVDCDALVPSYCGFPFPSNVYTIDDPSTPTGRRVSIAEAMMPVSYYDVRAAPTPWSQRDGFSPGSGIVVELPGATATGLAASDAIEASLSDASPTILLRADTGERVPHFAELDIGSVDPERVALFIRPAVTLDDATRYIVAIRDVVDGSGRALPASAGFAALRDGTPIEDASIEDRRPLYTDIFARLADAEVSRDTLQLAWDFTTASTADNTGALTHMRDEALGLAGEGGPSYAITEVDEEFADAIAFRLEGTFEAPMYLDSINHGGLLQLGADGLPEPVGTLQVPFVVLVPQSAATQPAALMQFGHGLLGGRAEIDRPEFHTLADEYGYVIFATDWIGLTAQEQAFLGAILAGGEVGEFQSLFDRLSQSMVNQLLLMRVMSRGLASDPTYGPLIDPAQRYYYGISLGGINGGVYMALSTDVTRGVLDVMGAPFGLLLTRAVLFDPFFEIARSAYPDPRDVHFVLALVQMLWDRMDPISYLQTLRGVEAPAGALDHRVLMRAAVGDQSVTPIAAHVMARSLQAAHMDSGVRAVWGMETVTGPHEGNALIEYDFGVPAEPVCLLPNRKCDNPHGGLRALPPADRQLDHFLRTGIAENFCDAGVCSFPGAVACGPDEDLSENACE